MRPDPLVAAALLPSRDLADRAWGLLAAAGIPAAVVAEPGLLGRRDVQVMVHRGDLERAQELLAALVAGS